jgi:hypothetical protein
MLKKGILCWQSNKGFSDVRAKKVSAFQEAMIKAGSAELCLFCLFILKDQVLSITTCSNPFSIVNGLLKVSHFRS